MLGRGVLAAATNSATPGFGVKYANPETLPTGVARGVAFNPAGGVMAVVTETSPYVMAYPWSASGFGAKYADPATLPASGCFGVAFSPAGNAIAMGHNDFFTGIIAYSWSGSGFGAKYSDPATVPNGGAGVAFSPSGNAIAVAHSSSPYITVYPWNS